MNIFLIIFLAILFFFGILLVSNIKLKVYLSKDGYLVVKYLFLRFKYDFYGDNKIKPKKKKKPVKKRGKIKKNKKQNAKQKGGYFKKLFEEKGVVEGVVQFLSIIKLLISKIATLTSKCKICNLNLDIKIASDEPADTAIYYGAVSSVVYPAIGVLNGIFPIKKQEVIINADYGSKKPKIEFSATLKLRVISLIKVLISFIKDYIQGGY